MFYILEKIIIDTDIGDDIDDAFALTLAASSPEIELLGITTVFRYSEARTQITNKLLNALGKKTIPVYAGIDYPLIQPLPSWPYDRTNKEGKLIPCQYGPECENVYVDRSTHAVQFIINTIRKYPGDIILVAIGPLTNISVALRMAPDIVTKIRKIVAMGGMYTEQYAEWNISCDPEAAQIVLSSGVPIYLVGLDVTLKCPMPLEEVSRIYKINSESSNFLSILLKRWLDSFQHPYPVLHDPLTIAFLIDPFLVEFEKRVVNVCLEGKARGCLLTMTSMGGKALENSNVRLATKVNSSAFSTLFVNRVFK